VAVLGLVAGLVHPLAASAVLVCGALAAACSAAEAGGGRRRDRREASEVWHVARLGLAVFLAGGWPLVLLALSAPIGGEPARSASADPGFLAVARADEPEGAGWEFGDFGASAAHLAPPPKAGREAEEEAAEYAEFEARYVREESLYADHEEETGDDGAASASVAPTAAFVDASPATPPAADATGAPRTTSGRAPEAARERAAAAGAGGASRVLIALGRLAVLWQLLYTPLAIAVALTTRSAVHAFNPGDGFELARRMGGALGASFGVYVGLLLVLWLLGAALPPTTVAASVGRAVADAYACLAVGCALGRAVGRKAPELALSAAD
jgi:hypothetical protein